MRISLSKPSYEDGIKPSSKTGCNGRRRGSTLVVDCSRCRRNHDIEDRGCLHGVLESLRLHPNVERILLSSDLEILYSNRCIDILSSLSDAVDFCINQRFSPPFDDCQLCQSNPRDLFEKIAEDIITYRQRSERRSILRPGNHGQSCERCVSSSASNLKHLDMILRSIERSINRDVFHVIQEDEVGQSCD